MKHYSVLVEAALVEEQLSDSDSRTRKEAVLILDYGLLDLACHPRAADGGNVVFQHREEGVVSQPEL